MKRFLSLALLLASCSNAGDDHLSRTTASLVRTAHAMNEKRGRFACEELLGGSVLAIASDIPGGFYSSTAERFDPTSGTWKPTGKLANGRWDHGSTRLNDGKVLVAGGFEDDMSPQVISSVEVYDPTTGTFTTKASMLGGRRWPALVTLPDNSVLALGGDDAITGGLTTAEQYDPAGNKWSALPATTNVHGGNAHAVRLPSGKVLLTGGIDEPEVLDLGAKTWSKTSAMKTPRDGATLTPLPDGTVLSAGGTDTAGRSLSTAEVYDPATNSWTATGSMAHARNEHTAVRVANGLVLVVGGEPTGDVEAYDARGRRFVTVGAMAMPREALCATTLGSGAMFLGGSMISEGNNYVTIADRWVPSPTNEPCALDAECESGTCAAGKCGVGLPPSDAGFDATPTASSPVTPSAFQRCAKDSECSTGHCVEGVCCDTACDQSCHSCALATSPGKCTPEPVGVDLKGECGAALSCTGTCGPSGACIGSGPGAQCAKQRCTSANTGVGAAVCAAAGAACPTEQAVPFNCGAYACEPAFGACLSSCTSSADCAGGFVCDLGSKSCVAPSAPTDDSGCTYGARSHQTGSLLMLAFVLGLRTARRDRRTRRP